VPFFLSRSRLAAVLIFLLLGVSGCIETGTVEVHSLKLTGVKAVKAGQLKSVLATVPSDKLPWGTNRYFNREQFDADLKRIVAFYKDRGYPDAKVASFDVKLNDKQDAVDITVAVDEGQPILVEMVEYIGFEGIPQPRLNSLRLSAPLRGDMPLDRAVAQALREAALDEIKDDGFPYGTVRLTERPGSDDRRRVLTLTAALGTLARYGQVDVEGNTSVSDNVVVRQLTFRPNWRYRVSQLEESQRKLYSLETFAFANIEPVIKEGEQPEIVPVKVTVVEGKHRKVNFGVGYGSEEHFRGSIDWRHVNFFGGARTLQLESSYSKLSKGARVNLRQPYVFSPRISLVLTGQSWHRNEPAYLLNTKGGQMTLERSFPRPGPFSRRTAASSLSFVYTNEFQSYEISEEARNNLADAIKLLIAAGLDPLTGRGRGLLSSAALNYHRSTADNTLNATKGYTADAHMEKAGGVLQGDFRFVETILEGRFYQSIGDRAVVALKVRGGSIGAPSGDNLAVPFYRRYWLGGATSLRGWGRFDVAPLFEGVPIGGHTMMDSSAELRVPLWRSLSAVAFADAGNAWNNAWDFNLNDLRYDVGPGLRYLTPVGPIRLDFGYQLKRIPGLLIDGKPEAHRYRFHFSIGQAF
jgi:outer membrane protein insertion porin family